LDGGIRIVVLAADKRGVRLGIEAPASISVRREELVVEVAAANTAANDPASAAEWARRLSARG
ncbi:MAG: carbon storage regulator, partial [Gemmatimonadota bacterium]